MYLLLTLALITPLDRQKVLDYVNTLDRQMDEILSILPDLYPDEAQPYYLVVTEVRLYCVKIRRQVRRNEPDRAIIPNIEKLNLAVDRLKALQ